VTVPAHSGEPSEQLFRFIRELLYVHDTQRFVPSALASIEPLAVAGETFDERRHVVEHGVKALTRHGYVYVESERGFHVEMVFDL
jgi:SHS2 domain-containing protein